MYGDDGDSLTDDDSDSMAGNNATIDRVLTVDGLWERDPNTGNVVPQVVLLDVQQLYATELETVLLYLHNDPTPPVGDTLRHAVLPMDGSAPSATILYDYNLKRDDDDNDTPEGPGLLVKKRKEWVNETNPEKHQVWRSGALGEDMVIAGDVTVEFWSAFEHFHTKPHTGHVVVFLRDRDPSGNYTEIVYGQVFEDDWDQGSDTFVKKTITMAGLNYTAKAGHQLEAKLLVGKASKHNLRFAYDTVSYPSVITLPTWVNVAVATPADFPVSTSGGDTMYGEGGRDFMFGQGNGSQSAQEADPADGIDNDRDGREGPGSVAYDCEDTLDNDGGDTDGDDADCIAAIDEDASWHGDEMHGNDGDDYMEGNHGADWMFGDAGDDDMIGGSSAGVDLLVGGSVIVIGGVGGDASDQPPGRHRCHERRQR